MSKIKCIIIEDEPLATEILEDYIKQVPFLDYREAFKDAISATEYLRHHEVDLIFLDIHLPKLKGMAFLKALTNPPAVIITTAYHEYAVEGYEFNVTDYLLKPIEFERFFHAVSKVNKGGRTAVPSTDQTTTKDYMYITSDQKKIKVPFAEIIYIESQKEYVPIVCENKIHVSKMGTAEIEALLPPAQFKRVHRSFIVALDKIKSYTSEEIEVKGASIPIGRSYRDVIGEL